MKYQTGFLPNSLKCLFVAAFSFSGFLAFSQIDTIRINEELPDSLVARLSGVKFVDSYQGEPFVNAMISNANSIDFQLYVGCMTFFKEHFGYQVAVTKEQLDQLESIATSACDYVKADFKGEFESDLGALGSIKNIQIVFRFCDNRIFVVQVPEYGVSGYTNHFKRIQKELQRRFNFKVVYNPNMTLVIPSHQFVMTESQILQMIKADSLENTIQGVYQYFSGDETDVQKLGVIEYENQLLLVYLSGDGRYRGDWKEGEIKGTLLPTRSSNDYIVDFKLQDKSQTKGSISFSDHAFTLNAIGKSFRFIKL